MHVVHCTHHDKIHRSLIFKAPEELNDERDLALPQHSQYLLLASHSPDLIARECTSIVELSHGGILSHRPMAPPAGVRA